jgi:glycosyltransferase involved in cell wall biosynthesis
VKKVFVRAPVLTRSGYGEHARMIVDALSTRPELFDIYLEPINWGNTPWITDHDHRRKYYDFLTRKKQTYQGPFDLSVQVSIPPEFKKYATKNIGITAGIETDRVSPSWINFANQMDLMIVTSKHAQDGFMRNDVQAQMPNGHKVPLKYNVNTKVINYPVKYTEPEDLSESLQLPNDFNFLTISQWGPRKNLPALVKWFVEEFHDEGVGLVVKTNKAKNCLSDRMVCTDMMKSILKSFPDKKCSVHLLHGSMTEEEIHGIYLHPKIKAYVTTTHGEGYGLPLFEAAYSGMPIAAPGWSGQMDFLCIDKKKKNGKSSRQTMFEKIGYDLAPIQQEAVWENVLEKDSQWCYPKEHKTKSAMRKLYTNYSAKKNTANVLKESLFETHSEEIIQKKVVDAILDVCPDTSKGWQSEIAEVGTL